MDWQILDVKFLITLYLPPHPATALVANEGFQEFPCHNPGGDWNPGVRGKHMPCPLNLRWSQDWNPCGSGGGCIPNSTTPLATGYNPKCLDLGMHSEHVFLAKGANVSYFYVCKIPNHREFSNCLSPTVPRAATASDRQGHSLKLGWVAEYWSGSGSQEKVMSSWESEGTYPISLPSPQEFKIASLMKRDVFFPPACPLMYLQNVWLRIQVPELHEGML